MLRKIAPLITQKRRKSSAEISEALDLAFVLVFILGAFLRAALLLVVVFLVEALRVLLVAFTAFLREDLVVLGFLALTTLVLVAEALLVDFFGEDLEARLAEALRVRVRLRTLVEELCEADMVYVLLC